MTKYKLSLAPVLYPCKKFYSLYARSFLSVLNTMCLLCSAPHKVLKPSESARS